MKVYTMYILISFVWNGLGMLGGGIRGRGRKFELWGAGEQFECLEGGVKFESLGGREISPQNNH